MLFTRKSKALAFSAVTAADVFFSLAANAEGTHAGGHGHAVDIGKFGKASQATRSVDVTLYDNYFEPKHVAVSTGETIRFVLVNKGEFVHEFNIGTAAMHATHQKEMMVMVEHGVLEPDKINHARMRMDMGGGKTMEHNDPNSVLLEPGKSAEIVWTFTKDATLEFACNVPGHYDAGMVGKISVGR